MFKLGLVVNPYAGLGGAQALKGSDGLSGTELPEQLRVQSRIQRFLGALTNADKIEFYTWGGLMGEAFLQGQNLSVTCLGTPASRLTSANDTQEAVRAICAAKVDLIVFVGGDGTARNVFDVVAPTQPVLGLPSGVKMQSACFAISPTASAEVIDRLVDNGLVDVHLREVRDLDEVAYAQNRVRSKFYGELLVPEIGQFIQATKEGGLEVEELVINDIADELDEYLEAPVLIVGPGTTTQAFMEKRGLIGTLLGFDIVSDDQVIIKDATQQDLERYLSEHGDVGLRLVLSPIGGQGHLIGRGNQQLSPTVLRWIGRDRVVVVATKTKLQGLQGRALLIDSDDRDLDIEWEGYIPVITGYRDQVLYALNSGLINELD